MRVKILPPILALVLFRRVTKTAKMWLMEEIRLVTRPLTEAWLNIPSAASRPWDRSD